MSSDLLEQESHLAERICVSWPTGSRILKMAADKPKLPHISADSWDKIKIPTAIPMFFRIRNSNIAIQTLCDVSGSQKSNMAAAKPEIPHDLASIDETKLKFQRLYPCFLRMRNSHIATRTPCDVSGSEKSSMVTAKPEVPHISAGRWDREKLQRHDLFHKYEQNVQTY